MLQVNHKVLFSYGPNQVFRHESVLKEREIAQKAFYMSAASAFVKGIYPEAFLEFKSPKSVRRF